MTDEDDCWDVFGSSSDEDEDSESCDRDKNGIEDAEGSGMDLKAASAVAMHLSQSFGKHNPQVRLSDRIAAVVIMKDGEPPGGEIQNNNDWKCMVSKQLEQRQIEVFQKTMWSRDYREASSMKIISKAFSALDKMVDALIVLGHASSRNQIADEKKCDDVISCTPTSSWIHDLVESILCPGGFIVHPQISNNEHHEQDPFTSTRSQVKKQIVGSDSTVVCSSTSVNSDTVHWVVRRKKPIRVHDSTCPWLSSSHSVMKEEERLHLATVTLSSYEMASVPFPSIQTTSLQKPRRSSRLTKHSVRRAVKNMKEYGYCIFPGLLDTNECLEWGSAVLDCVHDASKILLERDGVDIYNPQSSHFEPQSYREMSMREDLRMDLRHGPSLSKLRACKEGSAEAGGKSIVLPATEDQYSDGLFLRGHPSLLEVIRKTMNPGSACDHSGEGFGSSTDSKPLYRGNIGRWNFGGTGNNGSYQDLRISPVGGIVSLPGSADQALHADTPHLFEHIPDLPAHYINAFAPCTAFDEAVGGTAFVHGSHDLAFTAKNYDANHNTAFYPYLVRPVVSLGDVILFDCRILHFGLANTSRSTERCICYVNTWQDWFHDAKNWDKNKAIFDQVNNNTVDKVEEESNEM